MTDEELQKAPAYMADSEMDWGYRERPFENYWMGF